MKCTLSARRTKIALNLTVCVCVCVCACFLLALCSGTTNLLGVCLVCTQTPLFVCDLSKTETFCRLQHVVQHVTLIPSGPLTTARTMFRPIRLFRGSASDSANWSEMTLDQNHPALIYARLSINTVQSASRFMYSLLFSTFPFVF